MNLQNFGAYHIKPLITAVVKEAGTMILINDTMN